MADEKNANILDLDKFLPDDKEVVIGGNTYKVSGSSSVRVILSLMKDAERWEKAPASERSIENLLSSIQAFFVTPIERDVLVTLDIKGQLPKLIAFLYGNYKIPEKETPGDAEKKADSQPK
jgi:hypothetical protein